MEKHYKCNDCGIIINMAEAKKSGIKCPKCTKDTEFISELDEKLNKIWKEEFGEDFKI